MDLSRWQSIPAFSLGSYGSLAAHSAFWLGLLLVLFASGMGLGRLYGATLSALIGSKGMWWTRFAAFASILRSQKTSTMTAEWTEDQEKECMQRQGLIPPDEEIPGWEMKGRLKSLENEQKKRMKGMARLLGGGLACIFAASWGVLAWMAVYHSREIKALKQELHDVRDAPPNTIVRRNIAVIARTDEWTFDGWVFDHAAHTWERFTFNVCHGPLKLTPDIQAGATITLWQYQEDTDHRCMDISNRTHAAIGVEMDGHGVPILTSYAEPPAWRPDANRP